MVNSFISAHLKMPSWYWEHLQVFSSLAISWGIWYRLHKVASYQATLWLMGKTSCPLIIAWPSVPWCLWSTKHLLALLLAALSSSGDLIFSLGDLIFSFVSLLLITVKVWLILFPRYMATQCFKCDSYLPDCLTRGILEFGLNFLNFRAVKSDVVEALSAVVTSSEVCVDRPLVSRLNDLVA